MGGGTIFTMFAMGNILYLAGNFTNYIIAYNMSTQIWTTPSATGRPTSNIYALYGLGNILYVGGAFTNNFTSYNTNSQTWISVTNTLNNSVYVIIGIGNNLYIGGVFTSPSNYFAMYNTQTTTWTGISGLSVNITGIATMCVYNNYILLVGSTYTTNNIVTR